MMDGLFRPIALLASVAVFIAAPAFAQTVQTPPAQPVQPGGATTQDTPVTPPKTAAPTGPLDSVKQVPLFGNWGPRKRLADAGVTLVARYVAEPAGNLRGYKGSGVSFVQHLNVGAVLDLGQMGLVDNATVKVVFTDRLGDGLNSTRTGAYIQNQAFYGQGKNVRFNELSYEQTFLDKRLSLKGGFYPMGNDFGGLPYTCNLTNNGNCGHPLGPIYSSNWRDDPTGQWGGRIKWTDRSGWYAQAGAYDVNPLRNKPGHGFDVGFSNDTGAFFPVEIGYVHGKSPSDYAGTYKIGAYYDTTQATKLGGAPGQMVRGRHGFLVQAAQQIWKPHPDTVRGIAIFGVATIADRDTGLFRTSYEGGASWRGITASRPDDILSVAWVEVNINSRVREAQALAGQEVQTNEQMWEVNYGVQVRPWLLVRPGVQYVIRPGGYDSRPDTAVFLCLFQATL
jgi:porin